MGGKWDGKLADESIENWAKKEIEDTTDRFEALIKFLFSISLSSIVGFVAIFKLYQESNAIPNMSFITSVIFYLLSMGLLLKLALRNKNKFSGGTDLYKEYEQDFTALRNQLWIWFFIWCGATSIAGWSIYS